MTKAVLATRVLLSRWQFSRQTIHAQDLIGVFLIGRRVSYLCQFQIGLALVVAEHQGVGTFHNFARED